MSTLLEVVNDVLIRLRENEVSSVAESSYSKLIGKFVNDSKREVEDAWNWSFLQSLVTVSVVAGTQSYALSGTNKRSRIIRGYNYTSASPLYKVSYDFYEQDAMSPSTASYITGFRVHGLSTSGELKVDLYPTPTVVQSIKFLTVIPQSALSVSGSEDNIGITVPEDPIIYGTWLKAISERGEDGGSLYDEVNLQYKSAVADAISYDVAQHLNGESDWFVSLNEC